MNLINTIITEIGPISSIEILDYLNSDLFYERGNFSSEEWTRSKIQYQMDKLAREKENVYKFTCNSGFKTRYGTTKFNYFLSEEPRFLKVRGYLKRCMYCGIPIYIHDTKIFHFNFKCDQFYPQSYFNLLKVNDFWAIISKDYIYGVLEDFQTCMLRLPGIIKLKSKKDVQSEFWMINLKAKEQELIESDRILLIYAEETLI